MVEDLSRLFVAVPLDDEVRHGLSALLLDVVPEGLPGRVVRPPNWHLTLRFLGDVDEVGTDRLMAALDQTDLGQAFTMTWGGLGAFPRPQRATVMWVGAHGDGSRLDQLAAATETAAVAAGFSEEDRPFRPHLTLSRIRPPRDVAPLLEAVHSFEVPMAVGRIAVYRSHLGRGGARYEEIEEFRLG